MLRDAFVETSPCGRGQRHPRGVVGFLWRINDPDSVNIGHCFLAGRLKRDDLFLSVAHTGDHFQEYMHVKKYSNGMMGDPGIRFGSYGIGDAEKIEIQSGEFEILVGGGFVHMEW